MLCTSTVRDVDDKGRMLGSINSGGLSIIIALFKEVCAVDNVAEF